MNISISSVKEGTAGACKSGLNAVQWLGRTVWGMGGSGIDGIKATGSKALELACRLWAFVKPVIAQVATWVASPVGLGALLLGAAGLCIWQAMKSEDDTKKYVFAAVGVTAAIVAGAIVGPAIVPLALV